MNSPKSQGRQTMLTEDGELREVDTSVQDAQQVLYCIYCGTPNRTDGSFCRHCGQSLDEQELHNDMPIRYGAGGKIKRSGVQRARQTDRTTRTIPVLVFEVIKLVVIAALVYQVAKPFNNIGGIALAGFILTAWILVEAFQNGAISSSDSKHEDK